MEAASNCSHMGRFLRPPVMGTTAETLFHMGRFLRPLVTGTTVETLFLMVRFPRPPVTVTTAATCGWSSSHFKKQVYSGLPAASSEVGVWA
jgi:hypothetical protein